MERLLSFTPQSTSLQINGETSQLDSDLTSWCQMASEVRPFVLLAGALASLMIISGVSLYEVMTNVAFSNFI